MNDDGASTETASGCSFLSKELDFYALSCRCGDLHMPECIAAHHFFNGKRGLRLISVKKNDAEGG